VFEQTDERTQRLFGGFVSAASQAGS
jgi:hypothetical protein